MFELYKAVIIKLLLFVFLAWTFTPRIDLGEVLKNFTKINNAQSN